MTLPRKGEVHSRAMELVARSGDLAVLRDGRGTFTGRVNDSLVAQGRGIWSGSDLCYDGMWEDGTMNGQGKLVFADGWEYTGDMRNNRFHGEGTARCSRMMYTGTWADGFPEGHGIRVFADGWGYCGGFRRGKRHDHGVLCDAAARTRYVGAWKDDMRHGEGKAYHPNGYKQFGRWKEDIFVGGHGARTYRDGKLHYASGSCFTGSIDREGLPHMNNAVMRYSNGDTLIGDFCHGHPVGDGVYHRADNGAWFEGSFWVDPATSITHAVGTIVYPCSDAEGAPLRYDGECRYGRRHGRGTLWRVGGAVEKGEWADDARVDGAELFGAEFDDVRAFLAER